MISSGELGNAAFAWFADVGKVLLGAGIAGVHTDVSV